MSPILSQMRVGQGGYRTLINDIRAPYPVTAPKLFRVDWKIVVRIELLAGDWNNATMAQRAYHFCILEICLRRWTQANVQVHSLWRSPS
jgi:hypothetical protein